jgi:hypothetical protein
MLQNLVTFGDSVTWGQGHLDPNKFAVQVANAFGLNLKMMAHSGATIGRGDLQTGRCGPESPNHYPTILQQLVAATDDPAEAAIVIVDGGINDVGVQTILGPWVVPEYLRYVTRRYCHDDMVYLLERTLARYTSPQTRIVVTSYFPVLSSESKPERVLEFLMGLGIAPSPQLRNLAGQTAFALRSIELALIFWRESRTQLQKAVAEIGSERVRFADVPFTEHNAMFADAPWLFNVHFDTATLRIVPEDDVIADRHEQCLKCHPHDPFGVGACDIASAGHPNRPGAEEYTKTILSVL